MSEELLSLRQVARMLGVSEQRVYQLDAELSPVLVARGEKMQTRYYRQDVVKNAMVSRNAKARPLAARELDKLAGVHAGRWLRMISEHEDVSFGEVDAKDAAALRRRLRKLADRLERGRVRV